MGQGQGGLGAAEVRSRITDLQYMGNQENDGDTEIDEESHNQNERSVSSGSHFLVPVNPHPLATTELRSNTVSRRVDQKARLLWKRHYRGLEEHRVLIQLTKNQRRQELDSLWNDLDEAEYQVWVQRAEDQLAVKREAPLALLPQVSTSGVSRYRMTTREPEVPLSSTFVNSESDADAQPLPLTTLGRELTRPSEEETHQATKVEQLSGAAFNMNYPPLKNKKEKVIRRRKRGKTCWKESFTSENGELLDPDNQNKKHRNIQWRDLDEAEKEEWMTKADNIMWGKEGQANSQNSTTSTTSTTVTEKRLTRWLRGRIAKLENKSVLQLREDVVIDMKKPQDDFKVQVDNSDSPFIPVLTCKPNSLSGIHSASAGFTPRLRTTEHGTEGYVHPYEEELKVWNPTESQLSLQSTPQILSEIHPDEVFELLSTPGEVDEMMQCLLKATEIGVDLEHHSVRSFMGLTCLIQISTRTQDFIIDGLAMHRNLESLNQVFTNPQIIKVFHGAANDIQWLQRDFGIYIVGLFDTAIASAHLHGKQESLKTLLQTYVGIDVDKTHQIADWRLRPLPPDMLHYARSDTHYLLHLYDLLKIALTNEGTDDKLRATFQDSNLLCLTVYEKPSSTPSQTLLRSIESFNKAQKVAFHELFKWRDAIAREEDESGPLWVLSNKGLESLARLLPPRSLFLREILESNCNDVISPLVERYMDTLIWIIQNARQIPLVDEDRNGMAEDDHQGWMEELQDNPYERIRSLAIIPTVKELFSEAENEIEGNVTVGRYEHVKHYMNVQFQLLREDFIRSLKPGFKLCKQGKLNQLRPGCGIRVHSSVELIGFGKSKKKNQWSLQLPPALTHAMNNSKRLMPGSILFFTDNNFEDCYSGLIAHPRNDEAFEDERQGIISVTIKGELPTQPWIQGQDFLTVECDQYFEPYRSVLTTLKQIYWLDKISIGEYILNAGVAATGCEGQGNVRLPKYLRERETMSMTIGTTQVEIGNLATWPRPAELGFDEAQFQAYQAALTEECVLIQGPPGTGKTFLGLQIIKTLMYESNQDLWRARNGGPILIACYTNHALDQFGDGLLDLFTPSEFRDSPVPYHVTSPRILRLGLGCVSPRLQAYSEYQSAGEKKKARKINPSGVDIILMTTTGAAIRHTKLLKWKSKILLVEEAAEVLESHIIASLTPHVEHLILLGDHQQLRPITATDELSKKYNLNVSLFERMVLNNFPRYQLVTQRRMRPEIRELITGDHIYPRLEDHPIVREHPEIRGMDKPLYFLNHHFEEDQKDFSDSMSKSNIFEVQLIGALCEHLLRQGYGAEKVTVLGMYSAQVRLLEKEIWDLRRIPAGMRIETVDSFQGEENDIVILSLVRSNRHGDIGFMKTDNRICVALSRARHALYAVGNIDMLASKSRTWAVIHEKLRDRGNIGPKLCLVCDKHTPKMSVHVGTSEEFQHVFNSPCPICASAWGRTGVQSSVGQGEAVTENSIAFENSEPLSPLLKRDGTMVNLNSKGLKLFKQSYQGPLHGAKRKLHCNVLWNGLDAEQRKIWIDQAECQLRQKLQMELESVAVAKTTTPSPYPCIPTIHQQMEVRRKLETKGSRKDTGRTHKLARKSEEEESGAEDVNSESNSTLLHTPGIKNIVYFARQQAQLLRKQKFGHQEEYKHATLGLNKAQKKNLLNRLWNGMDGAEKHQWMTKPHDKQRGKSRLQLYAPSINQSQECQVGNQQMSENEESAEDSDDDDEAPQRSGHGQPRPSGACTRLAFDMNEPPLRNRKGKVINLTTKGRMYWKRYFTANNPHLLDPNGKRKKQLNARWQALAEAERQEWVKRAESILREKEMKKTQHSL